MKKAIYLFLSTFIILSCGEGDSNSSASSDESSSAKYFIALDDEIEETNSDKSVNYSSDGITDETKFKIGDVTLELFGFFSQVQQGPETAEGKSFGSIITFSEAVDGEVNIKEVKHAGKNSIGDDYDVSGEFEGKNGEIGSFSVSMFYME